ncbi:MAG: bifunctional metallophosphatase/5'-nucleotidase [Proteobacteria bacterium]|nr:bifunctional metallophosphatase/5'-nucleotidase [Pseudomonadota bacterium]MBQ4360992.1 bifunctional metallophosphatase/5'-nucleotidase [Pseudomonadota bacterium]
MAHRFFPVLVGSLLFSLAGCASTQSPAPESPTGMSDYPSVQLLSWSDFHSAIYEAKVQDGSAYGGLPVFMAAVEKLRGDGLSLLIDGGDMCQGAMAFNEAKGMGMVDVMNSLNIDVSTFGNHEFDYGPGVKYPDSERGSLQEMVESSHFPWVNANIAATENNPYPWPYESVKPYTIIEKGPYKIAVIGVIAQETAIATTAEHVVGLEFQSPAETLKKYIPEVVAKNPDMIIVDAHITGLPVPDPEDGAVIPDAVFDGEIGEILALPEEFKSHIDLILAAHSHRSFIAYHGNTTVIESFNGGKEVTSIKLVGDRNGLHVDRDSIRKHVLKHPQIEVGCGVQEKPLEPIDVNGEMLLPSQTGRDIIHKYENNMKEGRCDVLGCVASDIKKVYEGECALGNMVADAMISQYPEADIALQNAGGIRIDIPAGDLYRETLSSMMPFENYLHYVELTGADVIRALKVSATLKHGTTQVSSGVSYKIEKGCQNPEDINGDGKVDSWENNCLCDTVTIKGQPLDPAKTYKVVTSDFVLNGGDDHGGCFNSMKLIEKGPVIRRVIMSYVQKANGCLSADLLRKNETPRISFGSCEGRFAK